MSTINTPEADDKAADKPPFKGASDPKVMAGDKSHLSSSAKPIANFSIQPENGRRNRLESKRGL